MIDERERFEEAFELFDRPEPAWDRLVGRRDRKRRNQRIAAGVVGLAVFAAAVSIAVTVGLSERTQGPGPAMGVETGSAETPYATAPANDRGLLPASMTDYLLHLETGAMTPLPETIVGTVDLTTDYAVSPDGSRLAYLGPDDSGERQIFVANLDGTEIAPVTLGLRGEARPSGEAAPAWSPDGSKIAYVGVGGPHGHGDVFVLGLATGVSTQVTSDPQDGASTPSFSPDGSSIVYSAHRNRVHQVLTVPLAGGASVALLGGDGASAQEPALSPDGSRLSYACGDVGDGSDLCLADADGSDARVLVTWADGPEWSPDGTRIAYWTFRSGVYIVDVSTGEVTPVSAGGARPQWVDDRTLIVEADYCNLKMVSRCPG